MSPSGMEPVRYEVGAPRVSGDEPYAHQELENP